MKALFVLGILLSLLATPPLAQGQPLVTDSNGEAAEELQGESANLLFTWGGGTFECDTQRFSIAFSQNDTETALGSGEGDAFGALGSHKKEPCQLAGLGYTMNFTEVTIVSFDILGEGKGQVTIKYVYDFRSACQGVYEGTLSMSYAPTSSSVTVSGFLNGTGCLGGVSLSGTIDLRSGGVPIAIH